MYDGNIPKFIASVKKLEKPNNKYLCEIRMATGRFNGERPRHNLTEKEQNKEEEEEEEMWKETTTHIARMNEHPRDRNEM